MGLLGPFGRLFEGASAVPPAFVPTDERAQVVRRTCGVLARYPAKIPATPLLVDEVLADAMRERASDIHFDPNPEGLLVRFRLDGLLTDVITLPLEFRERVVGRLKAMADLMVHDRRLPQEGHAKVENELGAVDLRISVFPTVNGEKAAVRLLHSGAHEFSLDRLGYKPAVLAEFQGLLQSPQGLLLLTGPTGSGKSTALYAALNHLNAARDGQVSIATVEDPVEYRLERVNQASVNEEQGFTYPVALKSVLRQDPQVIMIGEIRDPETARLAVQAGLTGHLVLTTLHAGVASGVFARLIQMGIEPFLLSSCVIGVLNQRLLRRNCDQCAEPYEPDDLELRYVGEFDPDQVSFRVGRGCEFCQFTGFSGRFAVTELLRVADEIQVAVQARTSTGELERLAVDRGMRTLWFDALESVFAGATPLAEALRGVGPPDYLLGRGAASP